MTRFASLLILPLLAACAAQPGDKPDLAQVSPSCAAAGITGLVDPRQPGLAGCANEVNLRMMVADPRDLERGVESTTASDERAIQAVRRLRVGEPPAGPVAQSSDAPSSAMTAKN